MAIEGVVGHAELRKNRRYASALRAIQSEQLQMAVAAAASCGDDYCPRAAHESSLVSLLRLRTKGIISRRRRANCLRIELDRLCGAHEGELVVSNLPGLSSPQAHKPVLRAAPADRDKQLCGFWNQLHASVLH